jgi:class 3 adenylate cyclase
MTKPTEEEELQARARALFDDSVERLDAETLSRLNQGRQRALQEANVAGPAGQWARWVPAGGLAAAAVVAVIVWQGATVEEAAPAADAAMDFEILLSEDSLDMLEDLEFFSWMDVANLEPGGDVG